MNENNYSKKVIFKTSKNEGIEDDDMLLMANLSKTIIPTKKLDLDLNIKKNSNIENNNNNEEEFENISLEDEDEENPLKVRKLLKKDSRILYIKNYKETVNTLLDLYSNNGSTSDDYIDVIFDELFIKAKEYKKTLEEMKNNKEVEQNDCNANLDLLSTELLANTKPFNIFFN
jgi:hypothetical protein